MGTHIPSRELLMILHGKSEPWFERLLARTNAAIARYSMIGRDERVLVGLSGGKDSLAMLVLLAAKFKTAEREEDESELTPLSACRVENPTFPMSAEASDALAALCRAAHVPLSVREAAVDISKGCFFCARARRKTLAEEAASRGSRCIALGHTQTDLAQTVLLNLAQHGTLEGLAPKRDYFDGIFAVIRPLIYLSERDVHRIVSRLSLPIQVSPCPLAGATKRAEANDALSALQRIHPHALSNIARAARHEKAN